MHFVLYLNETIILYTSDVLDTVLDIDQIDYTEMYRNVGMTPARNRGSEERVVHIHTKLPEFRR